MSDNTRLNVNHTNGNIYADDDIDGVHYQRIKLVHGPDGVNYGDTDYTNPFPVVPTSHQYSAGNVVGHESISKFGFNGAVPTTEVFISPTGLTAPYLPTTAVTVEAISDDTNDTADGSGAQTIVIEGLDASFNRQSATITMNGTTVTTATTATFIRVYRAYVASVGTYGVANTGNVIIRASGAGTTFLTVVAGNGQSESTLYTVAAGHKLYIKDVHITAETAKSTTVKFWQRQNADDVTTPFSPKRLVRRYVGIAASQDFEYTPELYFPEKTDIWFTGIVAVSSGAISVGINGILETA